MQPEELWKAARDRYWNDAAFHARVYRGVEAAGQVGYDLTPESRPMLLQAVALILHLEDTDPFGKDRSAPGERIEP
jgi:hypothetical protein